MHAYCTENSLKTPQLWSSGRKQSVVKRFEVKLRSFRYGFHAKSNGDTAQGNHKLFLVAVFKHSLKAFSGISGSFLKFSMMASACEMHGLFIAVPPNSLRRRKSTLPLLITAKRPKNSLTTSKICTSYPQRGNGW